MDAHVAALAAQGPPHAHHRAAGADAGHEGVGLPAQLGQLGLDLRSGRELVGLGVVRVRELAGQERAGILLRVLLGHPHGADEPALGLGHRDHVGAEAVHQLGALQAMLTFVLAMAIMLSVDWPLALLAILPAPLVSLVVTRFGRIIHERFERIQAMFSDISSRVQENLAGVRVVRAYVQEQAELRQFEKLNREYIGENLSLARTSSVFMPLLQALIGVTFLIVLWVGGYRVLAGKISLGSFVMFNTYMGMLVWPMIALGWVVNLMQRGTASLSRIGQILRRAADDCRAGPCPCAFRNRARRDRRFAAPASSTAGRALDGIDLRHPRRRDGGHRRPYRQRQEHAGAPDSAAARSHRGRVLLDGVDLRELSPAELRRHIGFVPQETFLFSATLAENIAFGVRGCDRGADTPRGRTGGAGGRISQGFPEATRPWWASAASRSRAGRSSAPRSRARCCATRAS